MCVVRLWRVFCRQLRLSGLPSHFGEKYLGLPTCAKLLLFCQKLCFLTQRRLFSPAGSFQCLHTLASIKIAKRRNLPSKRRNLPAKRRFFLPGSELDSRRALFLRKSVFFSNRRKLLLFWETALILHVGRSRYVYIHLRLLPPNINLLCK